MTFALVFHLILALLIAGLFGIRREIGFGWSFAACLFLSPLIGLIVTLCSPKKIKSEPAIDGIEAEERSVTYKDGETEQSDVDKDTNESEEEH